MNIERKSLIFNAFALGLGGGCIQLNEAAALRTNAHKPRGISSVQPFWHSVFALANYRGSL